MQERAATIALWLGLIYLSSVSLVLLLGGGFHTTLLGLPISLRSLDRPTMITLALVTLWMVLSRDGLLQTIDWIEGRSPSFQTRFVGTMSVGTALWLCVVKARQHFVFQTNTYDLGIQASVAWNTAHGRLFHDSIQGMSYLGDHFSPIHLVLSLFYRVWESPTTLLTVQSFGMGLAAIAVHSMSVRRLGNESLSILMTAVFLLSPYLHRVTAFDFHPVALAVPIFLWLLDCLEGERYALVAVLAALALTVEETLVPPLVGLGVYMLVFEPRARRLGVCIALVASVYFLLELNVWMPFFLTEDRLTHIARYSNLGGATMGEIARVIMRDPLIVLRHLVVPFGKPASLASLLSSMGFMPLLAPAQLVLLVIPVVAVQLSDYEAQWSFARQYSATILPFLLFAAIHGLARLRRLLGPLPDRVPGLSYRWSVKLTGLLAVLLIGHAIRQLPAYLASWSTKHVTASRSLIEAIPPGASVCATQNLVPHLVDRPRVSMFRPDGHGGAELDAAEYLLLDSRAHAGEAWPFSVRDYHIALARVRQLPSYTVVRENDGVVLLKASPPGEPTPTSSVSP